MNYINLNRLLTAGAAALLLSLPMTACSKNDSQSVPDVQMTGTTASAQEAADTSTQSTVTEETDLTRSSTGTSVPSLTAVSSAKKYETNVETDSPKPDSTKAGQSVHDSTSPLISGADLTASAGEKHVAVPVEIRNNPGVSLIGISLHYDQALTVLTTEAPTADYTVGEIAAGGMTQCFVNPQKQMLGFSCLSSEGLTENGVLFTCYCDVPADAVTGTVYRFRPEISLANGTKGGEVAFEAAEFSLTVR